MRPTEGKCGYCKHSTKNIYNSKYLVCLQLNDTVQWFWTGCVMWEDKRRQRYDAKGEVEQCGELTGL